jgi:hypothetical protein
VKIIGRKFFEAGFRYLDPIELLMAVGKYGIFRGGLFALLLSLGLISLLEIGQAMSLI